MRHKANEGAAPDQAVALRRGMTAMAWASAHAGARDFSAGPDPVCALAGLVAVGDAVAVILAAMLAYVLYHGLAPIALEILSTALLGIAMVLELMRRSGAYARLLRSPVQSQVGQAVRVWTSVVAFLLGLGYVAVTWYLVAVLCITLVRLVAGRQVRRWRQQGRLVRTVAVVDMGSEDASAAAARAILQDGDDEACLVGVFSMRGGGLSDVEDLMRLARLFRIDEVIVVGSASEDERLIPMLSRLGALPANISVCTAWPGVTFPRQEATILFGCPVLTVYRRPLNGWNRLLKRLEDVALAGALLLVLFPLMLIMALAIKLDSRGPVLFRQKRVGFNSNIFEVFKFRTMTHAPEPDGDLPQARRDDSRVTRIGKVLRRTSLDELPQLVNVLRGDMSLVGPRPHAVPHDEHFAARINGYLGRHRMQPGITGWAQVNGLRGETETLGKMQRRVAHDLAYIEDWSLLLDLRIILRTFLCLVDRNAY
jgi:Undecaprenyl-phosphate glucose phosphotransferase